ncbi:MAG TPA: hypothetical protein VHZ07_27120 [Bryobacteraceae bacterium]|jgi:hypothetical protein|nr:hypothetical protein [Bryobacteraceae bacterium]
MIRMKALLLPLVLVGFTGALSAQTFDFDFTATGTGPGTGPYTASGTLMATPYANLPPTGEEYLANTISASFMSPSNPSGASVTLVAPNDPVGTGLPNNNLLFAASGSTFTPTNNGLGFTDGSYNYLLNNVNGTDYLSQYGIGSSTPNFTDTVTFTAVRAPWEPSDAVMLAGALLFGLQQFRKRRKLAA